jgi:hypothetical protein
MSSIIPSFLHAPTATFAPVNLNIGQTFRLNNSIFTYTIASAFDAVDNGKPVFSFPYYNNPFSNSCDVVSASRLFLTLVKSLCRQILRLPLDGTLGNRRPINTTYMQSQSVCPKNYFSADYLQGFVTCTSPTLFQMTWGLPVHGGLDLLPLLDYFGADLVSGEKNQNCNV